MIIYKTTNLINGKFYIGQDANNQLNYYGSGLLLSKAVSKYGIENFSKEILEYCISKEHLNEREIYWIKVLDARNHKIAYNIASGGSGGDTMSMHPDKSSIILKINTSKTTVINNCSSNQRNGKSGSITRTIIQDDGTSIAQKAAKKAAVTMKIPDNNNLTVYHKRFIKVSEKQLD